MNRSRRRGAAVLAIGIGLSGVAFTPSAGAGTEPTTVAAADCGQGSWVAGTVELCDGELVYRDYVYDDFGRGNGFAFADTAAYGYLPPQGGLRTDNLTDLVALRLRVEGGRLQVTAELNTVFEPGDAAAYLAVDRDPGAGTGGGAFPGVVTGENNAPLSAEGWDDLFRLGPFDPATNLAVLDVEQPPGEIWRLRTFVANHEGIVANVGFRSPTEKGFWFDSRQAAALTAGDISGLHEDVAVGDLTGGATRVAAPPPGVVRQRVYISDYPLGEGVSGDGVPGPGTGPSSGVGDSTDQAFTMLGRYQPYGFYQPSTPAPHGVQLLLHGLTENHAARLYLPGYANRITEHIGEARNRILAAPLGRGWRGWYSGHSERDVWDVLADVEANYETDGDKVVMSGYSMGGFGALRIASLYPDRFAAMMNWAGFTGDFLNGTGLTSPWTQYAADVNPVELVGNLRHVPSAHVYAAGDELVTVTSALGLRDRLAAAGAPSVFWIHLLAEHLTFALLDDWRKESNWTAGATLVHDPAHVTYRTDRSLFHPELDLVPDGAYWVDGIVPAGDGFADVDAHSHGCGAGPAATKLKRSFGPRPVPWVGQEVIVTVPGTEVQHRLDLTVSNITSLTVDTVSACLGEGALDYQITSDGPFTLELTDGRSVTVPAGTSTGTLG